MWPGGLPSGREARWGPFYKSLWEAPEKQESPRLGWPESSLSPWVAGSSSLSFGMHALGVSANPPEEVVMMPLYT